MRSFVFLFLCLNTLTGFGEEFRVLPYVQNPTPVGITIRWLSNSEEPGTVSLSGTEHDAIKSTPILASTLSYNPFKEEPHGPHPALPWIHSVRIEGLKLSTEYEYTVTQGQEAHSSMFRTAPGKDEAVRLIVYSDSETEPESSTTDPVAWPVSTGSNRPDGVKNYLVNQTAGYIANCNVMADRKPNLILLVGDLVEAGGEQRDWDEFWRHNAGQYGTLASSIPILPSLGNHENYGGPGGGYEAAAANLATDKYLTYFDVPDNGATNPKHKGRYYRLDYGPLTLISLDSSDGLPHKSASDTNHNLEGSHAPDFNPGSEQYRWLEMQLADARKKSRFTFVQFHHTMFGSGPHSVPYGQDGFSGQAGIPMRVLLPLFMKYGVDLVFSGHDELLERSYVVGEEQLADGQMCPHAIHFYDAGIGGDGLRGPSVGFDNPHRQFLAHENAPEVWENGRLISGGKHYGHLEVDVQPGKDGKWSIEVTPVYAFPKVDEQGRVTWERRTYADVVRVTK
ncbi:MAG: metallophosphoesterase family protein [Planctomycetales bacterium]|nr:metallophosphoesterase family protein [Planctomycetales bacterium]